MFPGLKPRLALDFCYQTTTSQPDSRKIVSRRTRAKSDRRAAWMRMCYLTNMRTPSKIEAAGGPADTFKQQIEADSITWKRDYKGCMVTIFGSRSAGWNVKIDKREPIILGYTRPRAIKYAKELIDEEQAKFHSRSAGGLPRNSKVSPGSARHSFPTVISADRRRG
jgi:hypothetical protein